ncbi:hypothetical protein JR065_02215 [Xanthomonas sp. AmX2]|uniref:hypothetical protein n=1 Tax=Xanthomonas sp. TaxID=29446 RepID=UPI00197EEABA|nr:hypothetical protein [Xanthomonas sp.]MBN6149142.1 hypothetical protein [Xanthomonas sp.]
MNDAQQRANAQLHALAEAYQHGRIGRDEYRARRRNVLAAVRGGAQGITHRNALRPAVPPAHAGHEPLPLLLAAAPARRRRFGWLLLGLALLLALLLLLLFADATPTLAGRSEAAAVPGTFAHRSARFPAATQATAGGDDARQGSGSGEIACA